MQHLIIDADSHVTEPADVWTARVPARYRDSVPHVENRNGADLWILRDQPIAHVGVTAPAGWPHYPPEYPTGYADILPAAYDAAARLRYLDDSGIWAQVLYPNVGGFGSENFLNLDDEALKLLCVSAYNDFLLEWCTADARRLLPIVATPFWDVGETVREIERCAGLGARGILFTGEPQRFGHPVLGSSHWDPLWAVARDTGLPIHFHIGSGGDIREGLISSPERGTNHGRVGSQAFTFTYLFLKNGIQCADLITSGVLSRFPELKFVSVESGIGWLPFMLEAADYSWLGALRPGRRVAADDVLPSDLFRRSVYVTLFFERIATKHYLELGLIPVDNVLFETDFPHTSCLFDNIAETIEASLGTLDETTRTKIVWQNAADLYGIAAPAPTVVGTPPSSRTVITG